MVADQGQIRCFIGLEVQGTVREALRQEQEALRTLDGLRVTWTRPESMHLTLEFLGSLSRARVESVFPMIDGCAGDLPAMTLTVQGLGYFGSAGRPRVIWARVHDPDAGLDRLAKRVREGLVGLDLPPGDRPFRAHITLGRVRAVSQVDSLTSRLASATTKRFGSCHVDYVAVFQSILHPQGARYHILHATTLKGA